MFIIKAIRRVHAFLCMVLAEIEYEDCWSTAQRCQAKDLYIAIERKKSASEKLSKARSHYISFLPPGTRDVWKDA